MTRNLHPPVRFVETLAKARVRVEGGRLRADPVVAVQLERQSAQSEDPTDWSAAGPPLLIPVANLEAFVFELRQAAREATA